MPSGADRIRRRPGGDYERRNSTPDQLPRRTFVVQRLRVDDADIAFRDTSEPGRALQLRIEVDSLTTEPFRSQWAAFDVLFRSNGGGRIEGGAFALATREVSEGRETTWDAKDVPVAIAGAFLGGPFAWITEGTVDVKVVDRWALPVESLDIDMDWEFVFKDIGAQPPDDLPPPARLLAEPVTAFLNEHSPELVLAFSLTINRNEFSGRMSPPLEVLMRIVGQAAARQLQEIAGVPIDAAGALGRGVLEGVKDFLDRRRGAVKPE